MRRAGAARRVWHHRAVAAGSPELFRPLECGAGPLRAAFRPSETHTVPHHRVHLFVTSRRLRAIKSLRGPLGAAAETILQRSTTTFDSQVAQELSCRSDCRGMSLSLLK